MASVYWPSGCFFSCCRLRFIPSKVCWCWTQIFRHSVIFKNSSNKQIFSCLEPTCFAYPIIHHLLAIDKVESYNYKTPGCHQPVELSNPKTTPHTHRGCWDSSGPLSPNGSLTLLPSGSYLPGASGQSQTVRDPHSCISVQAEPSNACCALLPLTVISFPLCVCVCVCVCVYARVCALSVSHVPLFVTPCTAAKQAPLSLGFPKQEYWSGLPFPPPGNLLNPGIKPTSLAPPALAGGFSTSAPPRKPIFSVYRSQTSQTSCKRWKYALSKTHGEVWCHY